MTRREQVLARMNAAKAADPPAALAPLPTPEPVRHLPVNSSRELDQDSRVVLSRELQTQLRTLSAYLELAAGSESIFEMADALVNVESWLRGNE